eukprot:scaffold9334_cov71-Cyclotella_meneghiniana.AAC.3
MLPSVVHALAQIVGVFTVVFYGREGFDENAEIFGDRSSVVRFDERTFVPYGLTPLGPTIYMGIFVGYLLSDMYASPSLRALGCDGKRDVGLTIVNISFFLLFGLIRVAPLPWIVYHWVTTDYTAIKTEVGIGGAMKVSQYGWTVLQFKATFKEITRSQLVHSDQNVPSRDRMHKYLRSRSIEHRGRIEQVKVNRAQSTEHRAHRSLQVCFAAVVLYHRKTTGVPHVIEIIFLRGAQPIVQ